MTATVLVESPTPLAASAAASRTWPPARWLARAALAVILAAPIAAYLWVAAHRLGYAYELDWMEGGSVALAARVAAGHSIYAAPSLAFVGWTYPPLYYWVAAAVAKLVGIGFLALRLVSVAASVAVLAALALMVGRETRDRLAGLVAAGLFAATFVISGAWFDTGRVDSLFLAVTLVALAWGRRAQTARGGVGLGVLAFLAFFTKQSGMVAVLPALLYLAVTRRRVGIPALLTLLVLGVVSTLALDAASEGWYRYYVFSELASQPWAQPVWRSFWTHDIWQSAVATGRAGGGGRGDLGVAGSRADGAVLADALPPGGSVGPDRIGLDIPVAYGRLRQRPDTRLRGDGAAGRPGVRQSVPWTPRPDHRDGGRDRAGSPGGAARLPARRPDPHRRRPGRPAPRSSPGCARSPGRWWCCVTPGTPPLPEKAPRQLRKRQSTTCCGQAQLVAP